ncbi:MAG TPA: Stk1 family PASTA domain-containing Ser/Thr kinase [Solirubrobacteraceae bacterium]|jgi:beta-lactam-binding protein with PASTA domain/predicted Ser/Thr protein kinase|nr:Stk1 family PASTA domain-containing Ser/Thr kinase [Solirubrobacteraceae bacterium]
MIDPGTIIDGRYRVVSRLGSGGMADVYLAQDQQLGRDVAVKVLHHHFAEDQEFVERFRREASSAAALSHPNIVAIFDRGEWNGTYYIAMEYVAGRTLKELVREQGALDPATAIEIVVQILRAARFAHRRGVIHRDLKPHNVILDEEGRARVTDFGIARAGASDMTLTGSIMGTAQYLSPEQAQGLVVSAASDLYSIGVILYELLTGAVPFEGETAVAIAFKQVSAEPQEPSALNPALPFSLDAVVLRALAKDPAHRYADADELIAALERERQLLPALSGATAVLPDGPPHHVQPPPRAGAGSLLLAQPGTGQYELEGGVPADGQRRPGWQRALLWALAIVLVAAAVVAAVVLLGAPVKSVTVPSVTGLSEQAAGARLRAVGLNPEPSLAPSVSFSSGLVIRQTPAAGSAAKKGSRVGIVVSEGPANVPLTDVTNLTAAQAEARLHKAHLKTKTKTEASKTVEAGRVIATEPPAETEVQEGRVITLVVSSGPAPVHVPDVTGQTLEAAEATLTNDELGVGTVTKKVSGSQPAGTVLAQSPTTGSSVKAGTKVELTVAQAPKEVEVPNVVGATEVAATAALKQAHLKSTVQLRATSEPAQVGVVLEQTPAAATQARKGTTVTLVVGMLGSPTTTTPTTTTTSTTTTTPPTPPAQPPAAG